MFITIEVDDSETEIRSDGTAMSRIEAVPVTFSLVATIDAVPGFLPVTAPCPLTDAIVESDDAHVTVRPVSWFPRASLKTAVAWPMLPATIPAAGVIVTDTTATGASETVRFAAPITPSLLARIVTAPGEFPVTIPEELTDATAVSDEDQVVNRPVNELLDASLSFAVACDVCFTTIDGGLSSTSIAVTGPGTEGPDTLSAPPEQDSVMQISRPALTPSLRFDIFFASG